jgi:cystathionine gamma-lyase
VLYPGLKSHPQHGVARKQMRGFGAMVSFYLKGGLEQASKFLKAVRIITLAESLGGVESLVELPAVMTHGGVAPEHRAKLGITDNMIRLSVGIEDLEDLLQDVHSALEASQK